MKKMYNLKGSIIREMGEIMKKLMLALVVLFIFSEAKAVSANTGQEDVDTAIEYQIDGSKSITISGIKAEDDEDGIPDSSDYYKLVVTQPGKMKIAVEGNAFSDISVLDDNQQVFANLESVRQYSPEDILYAFLKKGTYYIQVDLDDESEGEAYDLKVTHDVDGYFEAEPNNDLKQANTIELGKTYHASNLQESLSLYLSSEIDIDSYKFKLEKPSRISLESSTFSNDVLTFTLRHKNGLIIWEDLYNTSIQSSKSKTQFTEYLPAGEYVISVSLDNLDGNGIENTDLPYSFKVDATPVTYSEIPTNKIGTQVLFGKTYTGSLLPGTDDKDLDVFMTRIQKKKVRISSQLKMSGKSNSSFEWSSTNSFKVNKSLNKWITLESKDVSPNKEYRLSLQKENQFYGPNPLLDYELKIVAFPYWGKHVYAPGVAGKATTKLKKTQLYRMKNGKMIKSGSPVGPKKEYIVKKAGKTYVELSDGRMLKVKEVTYQKVPKEVQQEYLKLNNLL